MSLPKIPTKFHTFKSKIFQFEDSKYLTCLILIFELQLAQPIRMILEYVGANWKEDSYVCGPAPDYDKTCWFNIKFDKGLDFPNLPYLIDGKYQNSNLLISLLN